MNKSNYMGGTNFNRELVFKNISRLGDWLYKSHGLNLNNIILDLFEKFEEYEYVSEDYVKSFYDTISILKKTDIKDLDKLLLKKFPDGIEKEKIIKENGQWHPINKLNTNNGDLSFMLTDLIYKMMNDKESVKKFITPVYLKILNNKAKIGLNIIKPKLKSIIEYYYIKKGKGLEDLKKYTKHSILNSKKGKKSEDLVSNFLKEKGFQIIFEGGDGDFIDMKFGIDLIIHRDDIGYKTIQVKSYKPQKKYVNYYNVDWIVYTDDSINILDKNTFKEINV